MDRTIRVLTNEVPRLVQELLERSVAGQPDIELVDMETRSGRAAHGAAPDALIVGETWARRGEAVAQILTRWPQTRILVVTARGATAVLYELQPQKRELGELSPAELIAAIRASVLRWDAAISEL